MLATWTEEIHIMRTRVPAGAPRGREFTGEMTYDGDVGWRGMLRHEVIRNMSRMIDFFRVHG